MQSRDWRRYEAAKVPTRADFDALPDGKAVWARCLLARAEYGGMHHDVKMLRHAATVWTERFKDEGIDDEWGTMRTEVPYVPLGPFGRVCEQDMPLSGIDFHCRPRIIEEIIAASNPGQARKLNAIEASNPGLLKTAVWE